jgi:hypothetical protein
MIDGDRVEADIKEEVEDVPQNFAAEQIDAYLDDNEKWFGIKDVKLDVNGKGSLDVPNISYLIDDNFIDKMKKMQ